MRACIVFCYPPLSLLFLFWLVACGSRRLFLLSGVVRYKKREMLFRHLSLSAGWGWVVIMIVYTLQADLLLTP